MVSSDLIDNEFTGSRCDSHIRLEALAIDDERSCAMYSAMVCRISWLSRSSLEFRIRYAQDRPE